MSNSIENFLNCIDEDPKLKELIEGKRVCLCGPASTNIGSDYGYQIDSYDIVCRMGWHVTGKDSWDEKLNCDYGKRTDIMFSGYFLKYEFNNIKNRNTEGSKFNCFKDVKYVYITDAVNNKEFHQGMGKYYRTRKELMFSGPYDFCEKFKETNYDFSVINTVIGNRNREYINKNIENCVKNCTSSGIHTIEVILRHKPKELFITGMNFGNFGKGGTLKDLYTDQGHSRSEMGLTEKDINDKIWKIHTEPHTLIFLKKIFDEYNNIELDKLLKDFFDNFK